MRALHAVRIVLWIALLPAGAFAAEPDSGLSRWAIIASPDARADGMDDLLTAAMSEQEGLYLLERDRLEALLDEASLQQVLGGDDVAGRLRVGRLLRADALILLRVEANPAAAARAADREDGSSPVTDDRSQAPPAAANGSKGPPTAGADGGEASAEGGAADVPERLLRVVISDCRQGARLRTEYLPYRQEDVPELVGRIGRMVRQVREQFPAGVQRMIGVAPLVCRNLVHDYNQYQDGFAQLLGSALTSPGTAVIEVQEARAISRERALPGEAGIQRVVPLLVEGEYEVLRPETAAAATGPAGVVPTAAKPATEGAAATEPAGQGADATRPADDASATTQPASNLASRGEPHVRLSIRLVRDDDAVQALDTTLPLALAGQFFAQQVAPTILKATGGAGAASLSPQVQATRLGARAETFSRLGMYRQAIGLREAVLLIDPDAHAQRVELLDDYVQDVKVPLSQQPEFLRNAHRRKPLSAEMVAAHDAWCAARVGLFQCCMNHLEYLVRHRGVTRRAAVLLTDAIFRIAPAVAREHLDRVRPLLTPLEPQKKRFLAEVYPQILTLDVEGDDAGARSLAKNLATHHWRGTLIDWCFFRLDGLTAGKEDLDFAFEMLTATPAAHSARFLGLAGLMKWQEMALQRIPYSDPGTSGRMGDSAGWRYTHEEYLDFCQRLVGTAKPWLVIYGRYGLLERAFAKASPARQVDQEMLAEADALVDLYIDVQKRSGKSYIVRDDDIIQLRDRIREALADTPIAAPAAAASQSVTVASAGVADRPDEQLGEPYLPQVLYRPIDISVEAAAKLKGPKTPYTSSANEPSKPLLPGKRLRVRQCGPDVDVYLTTETVAIMRQKGRLEVVYRDERGRVSDACWDGERVWVASVGDGLFVLTPDGDGFHLADENIPYSWIDVHLQPLGPGRALAVFLYSETFRLQVLLLESTGRKLRVRPLPVEPAPSAPEERRDSDRRWDQWYPPLSCVVHAAGTDPVLLIGERNSRAPGLPLAVDMETLQVAPADWGQGPDRLLYSSGEALWGCTGGQLYRGVCPAGTPLRDTRWEVVYDWPALHPQYGYGRSITPFRVVRPEGDGVYAYCGQWYRIQPGGMFHELIEPMPVGGERPRIEVMRCVDSAYYGKLLLARDDRVWQVELREPRRPATGPGEPLRWAVLTDSIGREYGMRKYFADGLPDAAGSSSPPIYMQVDLKDFEAAAADGFAVRRGFAGACRADLLLIVQDYEVDASESSNRWGVAEQGYRLSVYDGRTGIRLLTEKAAAVRNKMQERMQGAAAVLRRLVTQIGGRPVRVVGVGPLETDDTFNQSLSAGVSELLALMTSSRTDAISIDPQEVRPALTEKIESAAGRCQVHPVLVELACTAGQQDEEQQSLAIRLRIRDSQTERSADLSGSPREVLLQAWREMVDAAPHGHAYPDESKALDDALQVLLARAGQCIEREDRETGCAMLEAYLLVRPDAADVRAQFLLEQGALLATPPAWQVRKQRPLAEYQRWTRRQADRWQAMVQQYRLALRRDQISFESAGRLLDMVMDLPGATGWGRDLPLVADQRRRLILEVMPLIEGLSHSDDRNRYAGRFLYAYLLNQAVRTPSGRYTREDLSCILRLMTDVLPGVFGAALPERLAQRDPWPGVDEACQREFLHSLLTSKAPAAVLMGRWAGLCRRYYAKQFDQVLLQDIDVLAADHQAFLKTSPDNRSPGDLGGDLQALRWRVEAGLAGKVTATSPPVFAATRTLGPQIEFHPIDLRVRRLSGKTVPFEEVAREFPVVHRFRASRMHLHRCDDTTDLLYSRRHVLVMRQPGLADEVFVDEGDSITDACWDGRNIWVAYGKQARIAVISGDGKRVGEFGEPQGLPPADKALLLCPLGQGRVFACGAFGEPVRSWCAVLDLAGPGVRVLHRATGVVDPRTSQGQMTYGGTDEEKRRRLEGPPIDTAFFPIWLLPLTRPGQSAPEAVLVGRSPNDNGLSSIWPLRVDLDGDVSCFDVQYDFPLPHSLRRIASGGYLWATGGSSMWQWAGPNRHWPDGLAWRQVLQRRLWSASQLTNQSVQTGETVLPLGDRVYVAGCKVLHVENHRASAIGTAWAACDPAEATCRLLLPAPLEQGGMGGISVHYGLVGWGWDRRAAASQQEIQRGGDPKPPPFRLYRVTVGDEGEPGP